MKIGVFDSGVGGLTVLKELVPKAPHAEYLYFGDTARLPYGSKSAETVARYTISACKFLRQHGAEMMVIACNTATSLALPEITKAMDVPVIGVVEPGADAAAKLSKTKNVAVIATAGTVGSHAYKRALAARGIEAHEQACPLFVPLVEEGWVDHPVTEQVAHIYMDEVFRNGSKDTDVLVLGCTHYPLLRPLLRRVVPNQVEIVDSAESTAEAVAKQLNAQPGTAVPHKSAKLETRNSKLVFFATDSVEKFRALGERFMGHKLENIQHVDIEP
jgi:glutamate racemase